MTCTSFARHTGCWRCIESWRRNCRTTHRSLCIMGRLKCGTELVFHLRGLTSSQELPEEWIQKPLCGVGTRPCQGVSKGSKSSGFQLVSQSLCSISWNGKRKNILFCSNASRRWRIHRQHGCCCWCALPPGRTTGWGVCDLTSQKRSRIVMMIASGSVFARFCKSLQIIMWPESQLRFRFLWAAWDSHTASRSREGAHFASLADCLPMVHERHPHSGSDHGARDGQGPMPVRSPLGHCWRIAPLLPEPIPQNPASPSLGGSTKPHGVSSSTTPYTGQNCQTPERVLMRSQHGPLVSAALTAVPTNRMTRIEAQPFRLLLLRRLRLPLPLTSRTCRCGRQLDSFGHHRAACSVAGVLGRRGFPLEQAAAQVCREAGARVRTNTFVRDMDLEGVHVFDGRRLEVVADGLTLWHGAQLTGHHTGVTLAPGRHCQANSSWPKRGTTEASETFEGEHLPGALRRRRKGTLGGACCRSRRAMVWGDSAVLASSRQSARSDSTLDPPEPR